MSGRRRIAAASRKPQAMQGKSASSFATASCSSYKLALFSSSRSSFAATAAAAAMIVGLLLSLWSSTFPTATSTLFANAAPLSKPYIAYRTDPFDQGAAVDHELDYESAAAAARGTRQQRSPSEPSFYRYDQVDKEQCPLRFSMGLAQKLHASFANNEIRTAPVLATALPAAGPGKQVVYNYYEHVDLLTPVLLLPPTTNDANNNKLNYEPADPVSAAASQKKNKKGQQSSAESSFTNPSSATVITEALQQPPEFPLLLESSAFLSDPILMDVNGDGVLDILTADYDGGITALGVVVTATDGGGGDSNQQRHFHHAQVPRLYVRREWLAAAAGYNSSLVRSNETVWKINATTGVGAYQEHREATVSDPYHSYFEYHYVDPGDRTGGSGDSALIRGETASILHQSEPDATARKRRQRQQQQQAVAARRRLLERQHRRLEEEEESKAEERDGERQQQEERREEEEEEEEEGEYQRGGAANLEDGDDIPFVDETDRGTDDLTAATDDDAVAARSRDDRVEPPDGNNNHNNGGDDAMIYGDDYEYERMHGDGGGMVDDDYARYAGGYYGDDMYGGGYNQQHADYYHDRHYLRVPPHILTTPVLAEVPRLFGNTHERDDILVVAVSYYLDEDEYDEGFQTAYRRFARGSNDDVGDETEAQRGGYVASAVMGYIYSSDDTAGGGSGGRWTGQTHLDLSTDFTAPANATVVGHLEERSDATRMGAFALSSPAVADLDGDGSPEVVIGTGMGLLYAFDARNMFRRDRWPVQVKRPIEQRILVEDVVGNFNLEVFAADIGGNVYCLNHEAQLIWHVNWIGALNLVAQDDGSNVVTASSPLTLGDVNADGKLDLVQVVRIDNQRTFVFAVTAATGETLPRFPIEIESTVPPKFNPDLQELHQKLAQPLLVDLHADQSFVTDYLRRNGTHWEQRPATTAGKAPHGGRGSGLHIVQPHGEDLFIIEGYTGCTQKISIGEQVSAMVQVDDVHGTQRLDLVVATEAGRLVTLESPAPYHPLNTWTGGQLRSHRAATHAHGYSASQGIYVHSVSRQFVDVFGVYVPVTFEIFDNRPGLAAAEPDQRKYVVEIRDGPSWRRVLWRNEYTEPGVYTDRVYIRYGPGYYTLSVVMLTSHGIIYEDQFSIGYNVKFLDGFGILLWLPLLVASVGILLCGTRRTANWEDEEFDGGGGGGGGRNNRLGILGRALPT